MRRRVPIGTLVAALGGLLLGVSLFLDWYEELTAFTVFEVLDLVLAGLVIASLLSLLEQLGVRPAWPALGSAAALPLGTVALAIVVSQLVNHPPGAVGRDEELGIWLALAGSALLLAGGVLGVARVSLAVDVERRAADPDAPTVGSPEARPDPERPGS